MASLPCHGYSVSVFMQVLGLGPKPCDVMSLAIAQQATLAQGRGRGSGRGTGTGTGTGTGRGSPDPNPTPRQATLAVQNAIGRYDGTITRLLTDDKGTRPPSPSPSPSPSTLTLTLARRVSD